jgi:hypothetical protein
MHPKRNSKRQPPKRRPPQLDGLKLIDNVNLPPPPQLEIANLLPPNVDAPDWGTRNPSWRIQSQDPLVAKAKAALARVGIDLEREEAVKFERFLDDRFPRSEFPEFRRMVDGPNLEQIPSGAQSVPTTPHSKLANYRFIIDTRAYWRAAARILARVVEGSKPRPPLLRICEGCGVLFIARRANNWWHVKGCGSRVRMAEKRARDKCNGGYEYQSYEYQRKRKGRPDG